MRKSLIVLLGFLLLFAFISCDSPEQQIVSPDTKVSKIDSNEPPIESPPPGYSYTVNTFIEDNYLTVTNGIPAIWIDFTLEDSWQNPFWDHWFAILQYGYGKIVVSEPSGPIGEGNYQWRIPINEESYGNGGTGYRLTDYLDNDPAYATPVWWGFRGELMFDSYDPYTSNQWHDYNASFVWMSISRVVLRHLNVTIYEPESISGGGSGTEADIVVMDYSFKVKREFNVDTYQLYFWNDLSWQPVDNYVFNSVGNHYATTQQTYARENVTATQAFASYWNNLSPGQQVQFVIKGIDTDETEHLHTETYEYLFLEKPGEPE